MKHHKYPKNTLSSAILRGSVTSNWVEKLEQEPIKSMIAGLDPKGHREMIDNPLKTSVDLYLFL